MPGHTRDRVRARGTATATCWYPVPHSRIDTDCTQCRSRYEAQSAPNSRNHSGLRNAPPIYELESTRSTRDHPHRQPGQSIHHHEYDAHTISLTLPLDPRRSEFNLPTGIGHHRSTPDTRRRRSSSATCIREPRCQTETRE